tara:strand:- start:530 stop:955 length:426 start_codon:yes stop_codon:yes gene_type:complete
MATITSLVLTDTFNTFMTRVNGLIGKLNTITADASTLTMGFSSTAPSSASQTNSTSVLYTASDGKLKVQSKDSGGTATTHVLPSTELSGGGVYTTLPHVDDSLLPTVATDTAILFIDEADGKLKVISNNGGSEETYVLATT